MLIVLNPSAGTGTALTTWARIRERVMRRADRVTVVRTDTCSDISRVIDNALDAGERLFVAAGGDGTVNHLLQHLVPRATSDPTITLGAIALGSSNDFHKPRCAKQEIDRRSCRIDASTAQLRDVGVARFADRPDAPRYWLMNASIGVTAEANALFNAPTAVLAALKARAVNAAIVYAAIRTIARFHGRTMRIDGDGTMIDANVANMGIVKNPHFAGGLSYDTPFVADSGRFDVCLASSMSRSRLLVLLARLAQGRFAGMRGTKSWPSRCLHVSASTPFAVEFDGEVTRTTSVTFTILPAQLRVCQ